MFLHRLTLIGVFKRLQRSKLGQQQKKKNPPPPKKLTIESCIKSYDYEFVFSLSFFDYMELLTRAACFEKYRTISPGSSHTEF